MNNIFENAYFGKPYKTRSGKKARYCGKQYSMYICELDGVLIGFFPDGTYCNSGETTFDIISEWQEEIDPEQLRIIEVQSLAEDIENGIMEKDLNSFYPHHDQSWIQGYGIGFCKGYRKAIKVGNNDNNDNDQKRVEKLIKNIIKDCVGFENRIVNIGQLDKYITDALTEQDRIARAEERERCINVVQEAFCNEKQCKKFWICDHCCDKVMIAINGIKNIHKAMEGGNNDN